VSRSIQLTPWQRWAQDYQSKIPTFLRSDPEYVDKYAYAAWEECKKRCIKILEANRESHVICGTDVRAEHINSSVIEEIERL